MRPTNDYTQMHIDGLENCDVDVYEDEGGELTLSIRHQDPMSMDQKHFILYLTINQINYLKTKLDELKGLAE